MTPSRAALIVALVLGLLTARGWARPAELAGQDDSENRLRRAVVRVRGTVLGTGVLAAERGDTAFVVTVKHVVESAAPGDSAAVPRFVIETYGGDSAVAGVVYVWPGMDLAVIATTDRRLVQVARQVWFPEARRRFSPGRRVQIAACQGETCWVPEEVRVRSLSGWNLELASPYLKKGTSGGAVLDGAGDVIGLMWSNTSGTSYAIDWHAIEDSLLERDLPLPARSPMRRGGQVFVSLGVSPSPTVEDRDHRRMFPGGHLMAEYALNRYLSLVGGFVRFAEATHPLVVSSATIGTRIGSTLQSRRIPPLTVFTELSLIVPFDGRYQTMVLSGQYDPTNGEPIPRQTTLRAHSPGLGIAEGFALRVRKRTEVLVRLAIFLSRSNKENLSSAHLELGLVQRLR